MTNNLLFGTSTGTNPFGGSVVVEESSVDDVALDGDIIEADGTPVVVFLSQRIKVKTWTLVSTNIIKKDHTDINNIMYGWASALESIKTDIFWVIHI